MNASKLAKDSAAVIESFYRPPAWATGFISAEDAVFLHGVVKEIRPAAMIELGVAAGCSSAVILQAMEGMGVGTLHSFDIATHCYFDPTRPVGAAVAEMGASGQARWTLRSGTAADVGRALAGAEIPLAFVDANHAHPWPTLDVMALLPALTPDGWVVLHGISLARMYPEQASGRHGPQYLYEAWPGEKRSSGGRQNNIGAIRLLGDPQRTHAALREVLGVRWETEVGEGVRAVVLGDVAPMHQARLMRDAVQRERAAGRAVAIWGAGAAGRGCLAELVGAGVAVAAFIDSDPAKQGTTVEGVPVVAPSWLPNPPEGALRPFVVVASMFHAEITAALADFGYRAVNDYAVAGGGVARPGVAGDDVPTEEPMTGTCVVSPETLGPFTNGGVGTAAYRLSQLLAREGFPVTLLYTGKVMHRDRSAWQKRYYDDVGIRIVVLEDWRDPDAATDAEEAHLDAQDSIRALRAHAFLRRQDFQVVYFQEFMGHGLRAVQAWRAGLAYRGARLITWCHSSQLWSMLGNDRHVTSRNDLLVEAHERIATRSGGIVTAPSRYMADWVRRHWGIAEVEYLPYWFVCGNARSGREPVTHRGFSHLVFFGRLERRKGLDFLLGALRVSAALRAAIRQVSFLGRQIDIDGRRSGEYIGAALAGLGLSWQIVDGFGTDDALAWLAGQDGVLAVTPSVLDNFPFAIMELLATRVPFLSTNVGGIPEVVGAANAAELLMEPSVEGVRRRLEEIFARQTLTIDYRAGYDAAAAEREVLAFHRRQLSAANKGGGVLARDRRPVEAWVVHHGAIDAVGQTLASLADRCGGRVCEVRILVPAEASDGERAQLQDRLTEGAARGWWRDGGTVVLEAVGETAKFGGAPVLLLRAGEVLEPAALEQLDTGLATSGAACLCGYVRRPRRAETPTRCFEQHPLGGALELGFLDETTASTPLLVAPAYRGLLARQLRERRATLQVALQSFACEVSRGGGGQERLGVLPLRVATGPSLPALTQRDRAVLGRIYQAHRANLNSELIFPLALSGIRSLQTVRPVTPCSSATGAYSCLALAADETLTGFLQRATRDDAISHIVRRLGPLLPEWTAHPPRLYIYGAGEHSKVVLGLFPMLWPWIVAFLDACRCEPYLGKPCRHPDDADFGRGATVLYSSRDHEEAMFQRLEGAPVQHVRIYGVMP